MNEWMNEWMNECRCLHIALIWKLIVLVCVKFIDFLGLNWIIPFKITRNKLGRDFFYNEIPRRSECVTDVAPILTELFSIVWTTTALQTLNSNLTCQFWKKKVEYKPMITALLVCRLQGMLRTQNFEWYWKIAMNSDTYSHFDTSNWKQ